MVRTPCGSRTSTNRPEAKSNGQGEGQTFMTAADQPASASFHLETTEAGMDDYIARHDAERADKAQN